MSAIARRRALEVSPQHRAVVAPADPWSALADWQREAALYRQSLIGPALNRVEAGVPDAVAAQWLVSTTTIDASSRTVQRWIAAYRRDGLVGLVENYTGRIRQAYGWESRAVELYNTHANRKAATVAYLLRLEGHESATDGRVCSYIKSQPSRLGKYSAERVGPNEHRLSYGRYLPRTTEGLPVGLIYQGDGHKCDVYVADAVTGAPVRLELIAWLDVASRRIVGWHWCEDESAANVAYALSHALVANDHTVAALHTDNGQFKARMLTDDVAGFYSRFRIELILALPGNPHGKGHIERWFGLYEERFGKCFDTYCGPDAAPEHNRKLKLDVESGRRVLPSIAEYTQAADAWIRQYNRDPHGSLGGRTPDEVWFETIDAERCPLVIPSDAVIRQRKRVRAKNLMVQVDRRLYKSRALIDYNPAWLIAEYSMTDDASVTIRDLKGRFICDAALVERAPYLSASRIDDLKRARELGRIERLEKHAEEARNRMRTVIDYESSIAMLERAGAVDAPLKLEEIDRLQPLDLWDTGY